MPGASSVSSLPQPPEIREERRDDIHPVLAASGGGHRRMLVNYWYAHPVGHAIEGLRYCLGYHLADPSLRISLLLNGATPFELAECCRFVETTYAVPYMSFVEPVGDPAAALADVPRDWDWVVENHRVAQRDHDRFRGFRSFYAAATKHLRARHGWGVAGTEPPPYVPNGQLRLELPAAARAAANEVLRGRRAIAVILAGSSGYRHLYPSASSWQLILSALSEAHPDAVICLIGKLHADRRTTTRIDSAEVERIHATVPSALDYFDRPILEQIALIEASELVVSPHTGLAFAAATVGTPWLAISGGHWHEYFFNEEPVYSLLPDTDRYPCFAQGGRLPRIDADEDGEGPRTPSMSVARILEDLPELLRAADLLLHKRLAYEQALAEYFPRLLAAYHGDRSRIFSFDNIHEKYL
jgi:hypothetical protein